MFKNKPLLITGGIGSFGKAVFGMVQTSSPNSFNS